ncbi:actin, other eukaryote [Fistulifera solaris]|uniref:Actin, other eukaryote n=1 Tax=Fistulifera solaris TaxID=1519565 RepID=A0A1Z5KL38_FISSO|nr:actin, other eukaryote [Fistulifera solaris]|eukprot:GAX26741.1 actin, other eukaryote [Fistulifera solaris]
MYCGDETGSFVGDVGSHVARFGYGGDDAPRYVVSSRGVDASGKVLSSCYKSPETEIRTVMQPPSMKDAPGIDPVSYLSQGECVYDWDAYQSVWEQALERMMVRHATKHRSRPVSLKTKNAETKNEAIDDSTTLDQPVVHPLLLVAPGCTDLASASNQRKQIQQMTELCMETWQCPALFVAPTPMLAAFAMGRSTATVVDLGAGGCRVTPVVDGLVLKQAQRRNGRGGDWLDHILWHAALSQQATLRPRYQIRQTQPSAGNHSAFHRWAMQDMFREFRTSEYMWPLSLTPPTTVPFSSPSLEDITTPLGYQLPDGTTLNVSQDMCQVHELLFSESTPFIESSATIPPCTTLSNAPLHQLLHESLSAVGDVPVRKELASQIILVGGMSGVSQLASALSSRLHWPSAFTPKIHCSLYLEERTSAAWIGGSILTSLGSFQQLWLSQAEYQEYGSTLAVQRFP